MGAIVGLVAIAAIVGIVKPYISGWNRWAFAGIFVGCVIVAGILAPPRPERQAPGNSSIANRVTGETDNSATSQPNAAPPSRWRYSQSRDEMRGTTTRYALLTSENEVEFAFPYGGGSSAELQVRQRPEDGLQIILSVSRGQFICHSFTRSTVSVKFDGGPIRSYRCGDPSSGDTDVIFIMGAQGFLRSLRRAHSVIIEAEFYREGRRQFTFDTRGFEWN